MTYFLRAQGGDTKFSEVADEAATENNGWTEKETNAHQASGIFRAPCRASPRKSLSTTRDRHAQVPSKRPQDRAFPEPIFSNTIWPQRFAWVENCDSIPRVVTVTGSSYTFTIRLQLHHITS